MINKFFYKDSEKYKVDLTLDHIKQVQDKIKLINYKRLIIFSILTTVLEVALIIFNDIRALITGNSDIFVAKMYLIFHLLILITSSTVLILLRIYKNKQDSKIYNFIAEITVFLGIMCMAVIGVLDQYTIGTITSYITILVVVGITILIKPPRNYIVYSIPHFVFLYLTLRFQENQNLILDTVVNSTMFYVCVLLISKVTYENQVDHILKNIILEETNKRLEYISNYDFLTNLSNRRHFESLIKANILDNKHYENRKTVLAIMDIDHFKSVNDEYGHHAGDVVLQEVAKIIVDNIQEGNLAARWGGEEFIVLFPNTSIGKCQFIVNEIRKKIEKSEVMFENNLINVTASFGLTDVKGNTDKEFLVGFKKADEALYLAKQNGRNRIEWLS